MRNGAFPDINLAPQVLISCTDDQGCEGGDPLNAFAFIHKNNITDETCSNYQAKGNTNGVKCASDVKCRNCMRGKGCWAQNNAKIYGVNEFGQVKGEEAMMNEIFQRGPITCGMAVTAEFRNYTGGVFVDKSNKTELMHAISLVGWGVENGVKYWVGRNSWGTYWGENGLFRLLKGQNNLGIESDCQWAVPRDTWTKDERNTTVNEQPAGLQGKHRALKQSHLHEAAESPQAFHHRAAALRVPQPQ
jgi:cathepsin X